MSCVRVRVHAVRRDDYFTSRRRPFFVRLGLLRFEDDLALTALDDVSEEERFVTLGMDAMGRLLVVAYTWRGDRIRIISARKAAKSERRHYEMDR